MPPIYNKMKRIILIIGILALFATSCSPKINGVRKHRRDRNCGCENITPKPADCTLASAADFSTNTAQ